MWTSFSTTAKIGSRDNKLAEDCNMWTVKPAPIPVTRTGTGTGSIPVGYPHPPPRNHDGIHRRLCHIPTKSQPSESVGGLGQQILLQATDSNRNKPVMKENGISGSDVLWAIQRATAQRKKSIADKRKTKKKITGVVVSSSTVESTGDNGVVYSNVTPLKIESDWGNRLEEFEKVLTEFQETEL